MFRIAALNDSCSTEGSSGDNYVKESTKEAKEAEAYALYHKALGLQRNGDFRQAEEVFRDLIDHDFLQEAWELLEEKGQDAIHPGLQLLYSIQKNLASMATQRKDYKSAVESYLEAVKIDYSEVTVWYKMGMSALKLENFQLAKLAFEQGLECNPRHWPCLDNIVTLMYALNCYMECLYFTGKAFEMEPHYEKGHALKNKIFKEQPSIKYDSEEFFEHCDRVIFTVQLDSDIAKEYVEEALKIRRRRQELSKPPEPVRLNLPPSFKEYSWKCVGEVLISLFDKATSADPPISIGLKVTVPDYTDVPADNDKGEEIPVPADNQMEVDDADVRTENMPADALKSEEKPSDKETKPASEGSEKTKEDEIVAIKEEVKREPCGIDEQKPETDEKQTEEKDDKEAMKEIEKMEIDNVKEAETKEVADMKPEIHATNQESSVSVKTPDSVVIDKTEVIEISDDGSQEDEKDTGKGFKSPEPVVAEESDSVLEEINMAHSLLDSLSPAKANGNQPSYSGLKPQKLFDGSSTSEPSVSQSAPNIDKEPEHSKDSGSSVVVQPKEENVAKLDSQSPILGKSSSYGFSVSEMPSPDSKSESNVFKEVREKLATLESGVFVPSSDTAVSEPVVTTATEESMSVASSVMTSISVSPITISSPLPVPSSIQSSLSSPMAHSMISPSSLCTLSTSSTTSSSVTVPSVLGAVSGVSSAPSLVVTSSVSCSSPIPSSVATIPSGLPKLTFSHGSSSLPAPSSNTATPRSDHEYSKGVGKSSPFIFSSQESAGFTHQSPSSHEGNIPGSPGNLPMMQSVPKTFDPSLLEVSPRASIAMEIDERSPGGRKAQKRRRISTTTEEIMMYGKRRSARVRNTGKKKEEETVNFYELLQAFLPSSLKNNQEEESDAVESEKEDSGAVDTTVSSETTDDQSGILETSLKTWNEEEEVQAYLQKCLDNHGLLQMMQLYIYTLALNCKVKWAEGLADVYIEVFKRIRRPIYMPNAFNNRDSIRSFQQMSQICLVLVELQLDKWQTNRARVLGSPGPSPRGQPAKFLQDQDIPKYFEEDLCFLTVLCSQSERLETLWIDHCIRVYWMKAHYALIRGNIEEAISCLEQTKEYLEYGKEEEGVQQVVIPNCQHENVVNRAVVISQQDLLQKTCSVEETHRWYAAGEYEKVVDTLLQTFNQPKHKAKVVKMMSDPAERQSQLVLLQEALYRTGDYKRCMVWGEESFQEAYQAYQSCSSTEERGEWVATLVKIFNSIIRAQDQHQSIVEALSTKKLMRFSQNLIRLIDTNMSLPETVAEMTIDSVLPWILLYHVLKDEEDKLESLKLKDSGSNEELTVEAMSSSHMLLNIAHDYLGSRCWCTKSDGALLYFYMSVLKKKMEAESRFQEEYQQAFEQCVYCLYGHPNKKGKAKHLQDHNAPGVPLKWEQAQDVFEYFKPKILPEFDGYRSETISTEIEFLLKRITPLIPEENKNKGISLEDIQNYIEGVSSTAPVLAEDKQGNMVVVGEIYYLLGDYYLKNKETLKAIKFYLQDLCVNPCRLDSWAGMALVRMSQLESKLTSAELKMDSPIYKKSIAALRCFKRAVELDDSNAKLWIEYGTLAYQLHSHASRQIGWKKWFAMEEDMVTIAVDSKREMLQTALNCFKMAAQCQRDWNEDEWLKAYMQGKCLEKMKKPFKDVIASYFKALAHLHEDGAKYPKKIVFSYTTPHLAVEALEMYYRIHSNLVKALLKHEPGTEGLDYRHFAEVVVRASKLPFTRRVETGQQSFRESGSSADENSCSSSSSPMKRKTGTSTDHTYFRQKSQSGISVVTAIPTPSIATVCLPGSGTTQNTAIPGIIPSTKAVTTLELHSEGQTSEADVTLTTTECPKLLTMGVEVSDMSEDKGQGPSHVKGQNEDQKPQPPFSISNLLADSPGVGKTDSPATFGGLEKTENEVKNVLTHIQDLIEKKLESDCSVSMETSGEVTESKEADHIVTEAKSSDVNEHGKRADEDKKEDLSQDEGVEELVNLMMKKPLSDLHQTLIDRCRQAFELCLKRFPTHYKSHYRLAYIYMNSPFHKDLTKAHHILLGVPKWQQLDYMPCQGLFGERKQTKFFQGIWKIPIDEIDRAGSFPSHLNRCIELVLSLLKEQGDSQTLHQVHLQLNRQPEPGKKYLRDAEKKYYALTSHRYTLDAVERQIEEMRKTTESEVRLRFLMNVYKIWEHGVHKLNRHVDRTNKLLADSYRVVVRKLETLPHHMLLEEALRFCKQRQTQKTVTKVTKPSDTKTSVDSTITVTSAATSDADIKTVSAPKLISLANIVKSQVTNVSLLKGPPVMDQSASTSQTQSNIPAISQADDNQNQQTDGQSTKDSVIVLSDSSDSSPMKKPVEPSKPAQPESTAPTVKIKMGLLQAVKRLKPAVSETEGQSKGAETCDSDFRSIATSEDESEAPLPSASELDVEDSSDSSSSSSSASSSSSDSDDSDSSEGGDDEAEEQEDGDKDDGVSGKGKEEADEDEDEDNEEDEGSSSDEDEEETADEKETKAKETEKEDMEAIEEEFSNVAASATDEDREDEEESDDISDEIDLLSSDVDEKDDDKDKDYNASEDDPVEDDVIMISDDEFAPKGRVVIPSPPHSKTEAGTEVLVDKMPDLDPLISTMMSAIPSPCSNPAVVPVGPPVPVGKPYPAQPLSVVSQGSTSEVPDVVEIE